MTPLRLTRRALELRCLVCGQDKPFSGLFSMHPYCRRCGYHYEREPGYFIASMDVNFWVTLCILVPMVLLGFLVFGLTGGAVFAVCVPVTLAFPLWFFRYSKAIYMGIDLWLDPPRESDFVIRERRSDG